MKKNSNKQQQSANQDYLNFIRKNQQIVKQFKEISQISRQMQNMKKMFMNTGNTERATIEVDRYSDVPKVMKQSLDRSRQQITSLKELFPKKQTQILSKIKNETDFSNYEIYSRNLSIPWKSNRNIKQLQQQIVQTSSQIKFPKISTKITQSEQQKEVRSNSQQSLSRQKESITPTKVKTHKFNKKKVNVEQQWKKNYAPLSVENFGNKSEKPIRCKVNSLKLGQLSKNKINDKLIRTYYDYENIVELKERVSQLLPTFKPLQSKRKQRVHVLQMDRSPNKSDLQRFLEGNMIANKIGGLSKKNKFLLAEGKRIAELEYSNVNRGQRQNANQQGEICNYDVLEMQKEILQKNEDAVEEEKKLVQEKNTKSKKNLTSSAKNRQKKQLKIMQTNSNQEQTVYHNKIKSYREFLFLVNFCHRVFDSLALKDDPEMFKSENKYKFYIGPGNNSMLVKSLMKRRFWWVQVDDPKQANFVWTQLKINVYFQYQRKSDLIQKYDKLDSEHPYAAPKQKKLLKSKANLQSTKKQQQPAKVGGILRGQLAENEKKIFTNADNLLLSEMLSKANQQPSQLKNFHKFETRLKYLPENFLRKREEQYHQIHMHNHFFYNYQIGNKKALFYNLKHYYEMRGLNPFNSIPLTFHIKKGVLDPQYSKFMKQYKKLKTDLEKAEKDNSPRKKLSRNVWIVKPGQLSNRGNGITVIDEIYELNNILKSKDKHNNGTEKTYIVQKYIQKPFLYKNRKFDIRHYMMISRLHGRMRAYWFSEGYIRTSSAEYDLEEVGDVMIHLTNDAIQKYGASYGKYEEGNKLSYAQFQRYLDNTFPEKKYSFIEQIYPKMRQIATDAVKSTYIWMDPDQLQHNFEIFGLDFMIDTNFNVWLIEVNTNPCLQLSSGLLSRIIPTMVENALRLSLDPIFPPTAHYLNTIKYLAPDTPMERLQFELIFDESRDGKQLQQLFNKNGKANCGQIEQQDQTYQNDGKQIDLGGDLE